MDRQSCTRSPLRKDGVVVVAELISEKLGLSSDAFGRKMKRGVVYGGGARAEGGEAGRMR
jgi:hypothetical protein